MIKRTRTQWQSLFREHTSSGLSAAAFCRSNNVCPKYFALRKKQLGFTPAVPTAFVPVQVKNQASPHTMTLHWHETTLHLPASVPPQWVADCIKQLST